MTTTGKTARHRTGDLVMVGRGRRIWRITDITGERVHLERHNRADVHTTVSIDRVRPATEDLSRALGALLMRGAA